MLKKRSIRGKKSRTMLVPLPPAVECSPEVLKTLTGLGGDDINGDNDKDGSICSNPGDAEMEDIVKMLSNENDNNARLSPTKMNMSPAVVSFSNQEIHDSKGEGVCGAAQLDCAGKKAQCFALSEEQELEDEGIVAAPSSSKFQIHPPGCCSVRVNSYFYSD